MKKKTKKKKKKKNIRLEPRLHLMLLATIPGVLHTELMNVCLNRGLESVWLSEEVDVHVYEIGYAMCTDQKVGSYVGVMVILKSEKQCFDWSCSLLEDVENGRLETGDCTKAKI